MSLLTILEVGAAGSTALAVPGGPEVGYGRLRTLVTEAATGLAELGVRRGDRLALAYPNGADAIVLFLAAAAVATACPLNPAYKEDEFRFYLEDTGARTLLVPPGGGAAARRALPENGVVVEATVGTGERVRLESTARRRGGVTIGDADLDDVALILHTSGTTSRPKRVPLRHRNLAAAVGNVASTYRLGPDDVTACVMPLFHVHGLVASALATLASGGTVVVPTRFNPLGLWTLLARSRVSWWSASPTPLRMALGRAPDSAAEGLSRLRFIRSCSAALPAELMAGLEAAAGAPVLEAYGMTEASHQMASNPLPPEPRVPGTVGRATGVQIAIMDGAGNLLPGVEPGEIVVRGPSVIDGYEDNPEANAASFARGWFRTGDQGFVDERGYLRLVGRLKELINRGGEKIPPAEIDAALEAHPKVAEAVAFGVPHPTWGEDVAAAVVLSGEVSVRELQAWCRERLADFKVPRVIHVVDSIPRTATGKIQRRRLADAFRGGD